MDARGAVRRLLELNEDIDAECEQLEARLDDTAIELLTGLCRDLTLTLAAACSVSPGRQSARERVDECLASIAMVLEVWEMADVEVVGGARLDDEALCRMLSN